MKFRTWKAALLSVALALCSYTAYAQSDTPPEGPPPDRPHNEMRHAPDPERRLRMLTRLLNLTAEQQTGVKALLVEQDSQMRLLHNQQANAGQDASESAQTAEARAAMRAKAEQLRTETDAKITTLLDDNQKKVFADWQAERKAAMRRRAQPGGDPPPPPPDGPGE